MPHVYKTDSGRRLPGTFASAYTNRRFSVASVKGKISVNVFGFAFLIRIFKHKTYRLSIGKMKKIEILIKLHEKSK